MTDTATILASMLRENTGRALCDSGGTPQYDANGNYIGTQYGYGRNYERNQHRNFENEKASFVNFDARGGSLSIEFNHNVYHWLKERIKYHEELDGLFHGEFLAEFDPDDRKGWLELMEEFPKWLSGLDGFGDSSGIYGEGEPFTTNTYNGEEMLSQILQFHYFTNECGDFIALQIHGGADVRGGYTKPHIFSVGKRSELDKFSYGRIYCTGKDHLSGGKPDEDSSDHYWTTDDSCHWYFQGSCGFGAGKQLETYDARDLDDEDGWEPDVVCVKDGIGYCPICGARLAASS